MVTKKHRAWNVFASWILGRSEESIRVTQRDD